MLLDRSQIERWAESFPAQGDFPQLIQRLVYASTPGLVKCNIPFGSAVNMGDLTEMSSLPKRVRLYQRGDVSWNLEPISLSKPKLKATIIREVIMNMRD